MRTEVFFPDHFRITMPWPIGDDVIKRAKKPPTLRTYGSALIAALSFAAAFAVAGDERRDAISVGGRKQLFVDSRFIESSRGIRLTMNPPYQTGELLITADQPWETKQGAYVGAHHTVMKDGDRIRVWYDFSIGPQSPGYKNESGAGRCMAYAESLDGIHFTKPKMGLHDLHGYKETNVLIRVSRGGTVWIDPTAPPQERYRSQCKGPGRPQFGHRVLHFFSSPDGIHWNFMHKTDIGACDTQNVAFWDSRLGRYVLYARQWQREDRDPARYRAVRRLESDDLVRWENERIVLEPDQIDLAFHETTTAQPPVDYYGGAVFQYPDPDGVYIMLANAFWHWHSRQPVSGLGPESIDVRLLVSRDGENFERVGGRRPFLRTGPEGSWYSRMVWANPYPVRMGDELWIYCAGSNADHSGNVDPLSSKKIRGITRAVMRLDGFVSADADYTGGEIVTPCIQFEGKMLEVNLDTSGGGSLLIELLDREGKPIQGFTRAEATPLYGNSVRMPVSWGDNRDVSRLAGKPIKIRFIMRDCKLFAFQFQSEA